MPPAALGGMMPRPIHYWLGGRPWLLPRGTQFVERKKFSSTFFKRWQVSSGQRLLVELRRARKTLSFRRLLKGKSAREFSLADWGTFCKRKSSRQTAVLQCPEKPPSGRFFCCRTESPAEESKAFLRIRMPLRLFLIGGGREKRRAQQFESPGGHPLGSLLGGGVPALGEGANLCV